MVPKVMPTKLLVIGSGAIGRRVRQLLFGHGREGDDRRDARPHPARSRMRRSPHSSTRRSPSRA
jgi:hypothetical protein